ncbi:MAG: aldo/keto reductase [Candidatus Heimdallarchaeota archaeon]
MSEGIKGSRDKIILYHHLGSSEYDGKYKKTRSIKACQKHFDRFLEIMETDHVDIAFIHFIHRLDKFDEVWKEGGVKDLAIRLKEEGKTRFIGLSTHDMNVGIKAAESGLIDVIMIQISLANHSHPIRQQFLATCAKHNVGVIAMKPLGGGKLLQANKKITFPNYMTAYHKVESKKMDSNVTSAQCFHYILNQPSVSAVVPGAANLEELHDCLSYYQTSEEERDFSDLVKNFNEYVTGECVYCNHCQPCQADIDIGPLFRLFDLAKIEMSDAIKKQYFAMDALASDCSECGDCLERCPFDVAVIEKMKEAATFFE